MLFDILSTVETTASAAIIAAFLAFALANIPAGRLRAAAILAAWFLIVVALGATGALDNQTGLGAPGLGVAVVVPTAVLCLAFLRIAPARAAMSAMPLPALIAVHGLRVLGVSFVLLYSMQRLPAPFAPVAGWGDIFVGATAGPVAWIALRAAGRARGLVLAWNVIGLLDLVAAIGLGATSSPGPLRLFMDPPGSPIMTTLPWIIIPCFLVPSLAALHIAIFHRLSRAASRVPSSLRTPGAPAVAP
ncbi:MAG: hypothetical protein ACLQJR_11965 [Stellaceae bacterium]